MITLTNVDVSAGTFQVELDAVDSGNAPGRIDGGGTFALPAALDIGRPTDFVPDVGDSFRILDAQTLIGEIDQILGDEFNGIHLTPQISDGDLSLLAEAN